MACLSLSARLILFCLWGNFLIRGEAVPDCIISRRLPGITIITHGYQLTPLAFMPNWVNEMASSIASRQGSSEIVPIYTLKITDNSGSLQVESLTCDNCGVSS